MKDPLIVKLLMELNYLTAEDITLPKYNRHMFLIIVLVSSMPRSSFVNHLFSCFFSSWSWSSCPSSFSSSSASPSSSSDAQIEGPGNRRFGEAELPLKCQLVGVCGGWTLLQQRSSSFRHCCHLGNQPHSIIGCQIPSWAVKFHRQMSAGGCVDPCNNGPLPFVIVGAT